MPIRNFELGATFAEIQKPIKVATWEMLKQVASANGYTLDRNGVDTVLLKGWSLVDPKVEKGFQSKLFVRFMSPSVAKTTMSMYRNPWPEFNLVKVVASNGRSVLYSYLNLRNYTKKGLIDLGKEIPAKLATIRGSQYRHSGD